MKQIFIIFEQDAKICLGVWTGGRHRKAQTVDNTGTTLGG